MTGFRVWPAMIDCSATTAMTRSTASAGNDLVNGGAGNDLLVIRGTEGQLDTLTGGAGSDTLQVDPAGGTLTLSGTANITTVEVFDGSGQVVQGTTGSNTLDFSGFASVVGVSAILGLAGNDTITGSGGGDTIDGGLGNDLINGGAGDDVIKIRRRGGAVRPR